MIEKLWGKLYYYNLFRLFHCFTGYLLQFSYKQHLSNRQFTEDEMFNRIAEPFNPNNRKFQLIISHKQCSNVSSVEIHFVHRFRGRLCVTGVVINIIRILAVDNNKRLP